ncbi:CLUMA_CG001373, isoform A [Clunio marinus]|uniref:CLUMA_CG001373, isoform A n=1 Tax=Clunio marinus TaxID=568069 RepID=A0A1J1HHR3_9DIPT|nr:CLUMA_CG001373, isoform A [Clunio marinus]
MDVCDIIKIKDLLFMLFMLTCVLSSVERLSFISKFRNQSLSQFKFENKVKKNIIRDLQTALRFNIFSSLNGSL